MKNKKLMRAIAAMTMAAAMAGSVFVYTGCNADDSNPPAHIHNYTSYTQNSDGKTHKGTCDSTVGTCDEPEITENCKDLDDSGTCDKCDREIPNSLVPQYTGPAAAITAGTITVDEHMNVGQKLATGVLASDWSDGVITIPSGTEIRNKTDKSNTGTKSVKNGKITIKMPTSGTIKIIFASGSSKKGDASYKLTSPGSSPSTEVIDAEISVTQTLTITATAGTYIFEKAGGTVDVWEIDYSYETESSAIESIEITDKGATDYLISQQVDCRNLKIIAKDKNGVAHNVDLANCEFDASAYKPHTSGKYQISVTYHLEGNLDGEPTEFTASYEVSVYAVDSVSLVTVGLNSNKQVTVQQAYLPNGTFKKDYLTVMGVCKCGTETVDFKLKNEWVDVTAPDLTAEGEKEVGISIDTDYTVANKAVTSSYKVMVKAKKEVTNNKVEITVGATGDFKTLTQAVQYLKACGYDAAVNKVIKVQAGTYTEKVWIDVDNVTLIGLGTEIDDTAISYSLVEGDVDRLSNTVWALNCATVHVTGKNFKAYHIAIRNDFDYIANHGKYSGSQAAQGVALTLDTDGAVLYDCHLFGNQDTLYMKSGRSYYYKTEIDGNIDFIFGGKTSVAFFEECEIKAIDREKTTGEYTENGHVTAPQHKAESKPEYGYVFYKCNLTDDGEVNKGSMSLGRPWGAKATVSYIECSFSDAYAQTGTDSGKKTNRWNDWNSGTTAENADYSEYGSKNSAGDPIMSEAVKGGKVLTQEQAALYTKANVFGTGNTTSYTTAWDSEAALTILKILAGVQGG